MTLRPDQLVNLILDPRKSDLGKVGAAMVAAAKAKESKSA